MVQAWPPSQMPPPTGHQPSKDQSQTPQGYATPPLTLHPLTDNPHWHAPPHWYATPPPWGAWRWLQANQSFYLKKFSFFPLIFVQKQKKTKKTKKNKKQTLFTCVVLPCNVVLVMRVWEDAVNFKLPLNEASPPTQFQVQMCGCHTCLCGISVHSNKFWGKALGLSPCTALDGWWNVCFWHEGPFLNIWERSKIRSQCLCSRFFLQFRAGNSCPVGWWTCIGISGWYG